MVVKKLYSNPKPFFLGPVTVKWLTVLGIIGGWWVLSCRGAPDPIGVTPGIVTSLAELNQLASVDRSQIIAVRIEGTVWWSSKTEGRVILHDDTAALQLELDLPCQMPALGDRLILEGDCTAIKTRDVIKLSGVPVVDHDGLHPMTEKSGTIHLTGRSPSYPRCLVQPNRPLWPGGGV